MALEKAKELDKMVKKLKLESQLRKNLSTKFERQKEIAVEAQELAMEKKNEIEAISNQLSKYLSPQLYQSIFSGEQQVDIASKRKKLTVLRAVGARGRDFMRDDQMMRGVHRRLDVVADNARAPTARRHRPRIGNG